MWLIVIVAVGFLQQNILAGPVDIWSLIENANKELIKKNSGPRQPNFDDSKEVFTDGDILRDRRPLSSPTEKKYLVFDWHNKLWRTREVPYLITGTLTSSENTDVILKSLQKISDATCLKFVPKTYSDRNWIEFFVASGCYSGIGRKYYYDQKPTQISLGNYCVYESIIIHETLHALGFFHEQSRTDRDSFVKIYENRIIPSKFYKDENAITRMFSNFKKSDTWESYYYGTDYDYKSIMHYSKRSFIASVNVGNTIEAKFDPNMELGNSQLSETDIVELNELYQCKVKSGWGQWSPWSPCLENWLKECFKARVRICVSKDLTQCPNANEYGTQEETEDCPTAQCKADAVKQDGEWGEWSQFSQCESACGWGSTKRTRSCNNPAPSNGGKNCDGHSTERRLCRNKRCGGNKSNDNHFDTSGSFGRWTSTGFTLKQKSGWSEGPSKDHTYELNGQLSFYASARDVGTFNQRDKLKQLWSPFIESFSGTKCLTFSYMLNGADLHPTDALSIFIKDGTGTYTNLSFRKGGHQGNIWKQATVEFSGIKARFQVVFEVAFQAFRESEVAIDDIFFDHNACQKGLDTCEDSGEDCRNDALSGLCYEPSQLRKMLGGCCASCNNPETAMTLSAAICTNSNTECERWAKAGECEKNAGWMLKNCCQSCKDPPSSKELVCEGTQSKYVERSTDQNKRKESCKNWAKRGECKKNPWMPKNCCFECKEYGK